MPAVENKIPDVSNLMQKTTTTTTKKHKTDYDAKILDIESKYFTTADHNKFISQALDAKIKQKRLIDKSDIA